MARPPLALGIALLCMFLTPTLAWDAPLSDYVHDLIGRGDAKTINESSSEQLNIFCVRGE